MGGRLGLLGGRRLATCSTLALRRSGRSGLVILIFAVGLRLELSNTMLDGVGSTACKFLLLAIMGQNTWDEWRCA